MQTIVEEDDEELKRYERESIQNKQNLIIDSTQDYNNSDRASNKNKKDSEDLEFKQSPEINRFSDFNETLSNAIEAYQQENEKELNNNEENNNDFENNNIDNKNNQIKNDDENNKNINEGFLPTLFRLREQALKEITIGNSVNEKEKMKIYG